MHEDPQAFFARCCQQWLTATKQTKNTSAMEQMALDLLLVMEETCLSQVAARLFSPNEVLAAQQHRPDAAPPLQLASPIWLMLDEPLLIPGEEWSAEDIESGEWHVAAFFFRAPWSPGIMSQALFPPLIDQPFPANTQSPLWYEWRLTLFDSAGMSFSAYNYYYDLRTNRWRLMEYHECPQQECRPHLDRTLGYEVIVPCEACQRTMDAIIQIFQSLLEPGRGHALSLTNTPWQQRLQIYRSERRRGKRKKGRHE